MKINNFRNIRLIKARTVTTDKVQDVYSDMRDFGVQLVSNPMLKGSIFDAVLGVSATVIRHNFNQPYTGYVVIEKNTDAIIYTDSTYTGDKMQNIALKADKAVTVKLWIF